MGVDIYVKKSYIDLGYNGSTLRLFLVCNEPSTNRLGGTGLFYRLYHVFNDEHPDITEWTNFPLITNKLFRHDQKM